MKPRDLSREDPPGEPAGTSYNRVSRGAISVGVFHGRLAAPPYSTPEMLRHNRRLESNSTGSSFPADFPKSVPLAAVSLDSRQGQWESR